MIDRARAASQQVAFLVVVVATGAATSAIAAATSNVSGSAYIDYWFLSTAQSRQTNLSPFTPEAALKVEIDVHENVSFSARMCFGCHGLEIDRAHLDFTPSPYFNLQVGRIGVPFGEFSVRYDPTSHRTVSKPRSPGRGGHVLNTASHPGVSNRFGKYSVVRRIGAGGMAEVFKCRLSGRCALSQTGGVHDVIHTTVNEEHRWQRSPFRSSSTVSPDGPTR